MTKIMDACMDQIKVSDQENNIVGTSALATCVGFIAYSPKLKKALVVHFSPNADYLIPAVIEQLAANGFITEEEFRKFQKINTTLVQFDMYEFNKELIPMVVNREENKIVDRKPDDKIEIMLIDGYFKEDNKIKGHLETIFSNVSSIFKVNEYPIPKEEIVTEMFSQTEGGNCFYFDASTGQFVTRKVLETKALDNQNSNKL